MVLAELLEVAPSGVEEVDIDAATVEFAVYGPPGEVPELGALRAIAGGALVEVRTSEIADDWHERWREFHRPLILGDRLTVRPPWEPAAATELDIVIDPGRAFGTGAHATTRLCLELLLELPAGPSAVDLGCGSGVLGITAARLGFGSVLALDHDPLSVAATIANASVNGVSSRLKARRFDVRSEPVPAAPLVLANLLPWPAAAAIWVVAVMLAGVGSVPGGVIASGLLWSRRRMASPRRSPQLGMRECRRRTRGDWGGAAHA